MKKYLLPLFAGLTLILNSCKKSQDNAPQNVDEPQISIQSVNCPSFVNSTWVNVFGGKGLFKFELLNSNNTVSSTVKDSIDLTQLSTYTKDLPKGTYNIYLSSKNQTSVADTFIRFNAQITRLTLAQKQTASLTGTTNDALITINKNLVAANNTPSFKADSITSPFKFALINGYYYLYVKGGIAGAVTFSDNATGQTVTKRLSTITLNQYNLGVQHNNGTLQVIFTPFAYNSVNASSSTLLTLNINTNDYYFINSNVYFIATDQNGKVLNAVKYINGTSTFKLSSLTAFEQDRFNFFIVINPIISGFNPSITGYLQVKKGSVYTNITQGLPQKNFTILKPHLKNVPVFDNIAMSTATIDRYINKLSDTAYLQQLVYQEGSKLWVQMLSNNQYSYNFLTIPKGTADLDVDLHQLTQTPLVKHVTAPGNYFFYSINAKPDTDYAQGYRFYTMSTIANSGDIYYPRETFPEYDIYTGYTIGQFQYSFVLTGKTIPDQAPGFDASFSVSGNNLTNFSSTCSGKFDYYHASFLNVHAGGNLNVELYSPSAGNCNSFVLPDFSQYLNMPTFNPAAEILTNFELEQYSGFNEQNFTYKNVNRIFSFRNFNCKSISKAFN
ncbi:hypothetical protein ACEN9X_20560 [Mucilaginibacter sp. Mucisp86]|uniref:hypothetical protein n=1 Tax=Mucilaginibacter sp. Mucisp86 TaxID=3243060 RepID=UPI0039B6C0C8